MTADRTTSYWDYIRVEELLSLQSGLERDETRISNDEVRFIVIHQIDELWLKLVLRELASARNLFRSVHVPETSLASASASLRRIALIFELSADHFRLMETMRTQDYLTFRDKLSPASGFQSAQLREIEILLGLDDADRIPFGKERSYKDALEGAGGTSPALERVERRLEDPPSLKQAVYSWLARTPIQGSVPSDADDGMVIDGYIEEFLSCLATSQRRRSEAVIAKQALTDDDVGRLRSRYAAELEDARSYLWAEDIETDDAPLIRRLRVSILFIDSNRQLPLLSWPAEIIDGLIAAEQAMLIFRQRHARMVERVIGRRVGTGGSEGVDYLDSTALQYRVFKEIWAARTMIRRSEEMPRARNSAFYGLRSE